MKANPCRQGFHSIAQWQNRSDFPARLTAYCACYHPTAPDLFNAWGPYLPIYHPSFQYPGVAR